MSEHRPSRMFATGVTESEPVTHFAARKRVLREHDPNV